MARQIGGGGSARFFFILVVCRAGGRAGGEVFPICYILFLGIVVVDCSRCLLEL